MNICQSETRQTLYSFFQREKFAPRFLEKSAAKKVSLDLCSETPSAWRGGDLAVCASATLGVVSGKKVGTCM